MKNVDFPDISFIVQYFRHPHTIETIIDRVRLLGEGTEIIIHNDSKTELSEISGKLSRSNEYMICSNDLNELRGYNLGIKAAHAPYVIISQDDDIPPADVMWYLDVMQEFEKDEKLGVVSLYDGSFEPWGKNCRRVECQRDLGFKYVVWTKFGPWIIRKDAFDDCGGFDLAYSEVGDVSGGADPGLCAQMWLNGWKVAILGNSNTVQWERHVGGRSSLRNLDAVNERRKRILKNLNVYTEKYEKHFQFLIETVEKENRKR